MNDVLAEMMIERYGIEPGNVDCDAFIECVDYGHGEITLAELDEHMTERGFPPNAEVSQNRGAKGVASSQT